MRQGFLFEHAGEPLSRYAVEFSATTGKPKGIARPVLFGTAIALPQPRLLGLEVLGEGGWLKTLRLGPDLRSGVPFEAASRGGAHRGTTAMASISTRNSEFANPAT
jgi:hypothetical protein